MDISRRTDWTSIVLLFLAGLLAAGQFAKIALALPMFAGALGRPLPETAFLVSALGLVGIAFGVVAGMVVARFGAYRMLLVALVLGGGLSILQAGLPPFGWFLASRMVEGLSHLVIVIAAPTLMAGAARPADQPLVMGLWGTFFGISFALAAVAMPLMLGAAGLGGMLIAHGAGLWALCAVLWLRRPRSPRGPVPAMPRVLQEHLAIYRDPRLIAPALGFVWHTLTFVALLTLVPMLPGTPSAVILPLLSLIATLAAGAMARRFRARDIALSGFVMNAACGLLLLLFPSSYLLTCLLFLGIGIVPGASFAAIPALNARPADRARAGGAIAQLGNLGTTLGTPLFALFLGAGMAGLMVPTVVLALCGAVSVLLIRRKIAAES